MPDQAPTQASREVIAPLSCPNAIIVDDNQAMRAIITGLLEGTGLTFIEASNGMEAFDIISKHPDLEIAMIDVQMPGLGGVELAAVIGETRPNLAVVIISGGSGPRGRDVPDRMVFLPKPFNGEELSAAISEARARTQADQTVAS